MSCLKKLWPLGIVLLGMFIIFCGFMYDLLFAGIPYQDPPPEIAEAYARHATIAANIEWFGLFIFALGLFAAVIVLIRVWWQRRKNPATEPF